MVSHEEIAKVAHELYEKSGRIHGRDLENWLEAERIVRKRHGEGRKSGDGKETVTAEKAPAKKRAAVRTAATPAGKKAEPKKPAARKATRAKKTE